MPGIGLPHYARAMLCSTPKTFPRWPQAFPGITQRMSQTPLIVRAPPPCFAAGHAIVRRTLAWRSTVNSQPLTDTRFPINSLPKNIITTGCMLNFGQSRTACPLLSCLLHFGQSHPLFSLLIVCFIDKPQIKQNERSIVCARTCGYFSSSP